jgi:5'(3')-deoxyribonucleotidase
MDDTIVDFHSHPTLKIPKNHYNHPNMYKETYFRLLKPLPGAIDYIRALIELKAYEVCICTQPVAGLPWSYSDKAEWIKQYMPDLEDKITMTQNKSKVLGDFLIDDNLKWKTFPGKFIHFNPELDSKSQWKDIYNYFKLREKYGFNTPK